MRTSTRSLALAASLATLGLAVPAQSNAALRVGVGDQKASSFSHPLFQDLKVKRTRLIVPYNAVLKPAERARTDEWMRAARANRLEIVVAFNHDSGQRCPQKPCKAPSTRAYTKAVKKFHRRYRRYGVKIYQPWNESNSRTQPTSGKRGARKVAAYYKVMRKVCGRRCLVTGADIQDIGDFTGYTKAFLRAVGRRGAPKVMGFHNYSDTNRFSTKNTRKFIRALPRGMKVWLTETGAVHSLTLFDGRVSLPPDEQRGARSMSHMFKIARKFRRNIDRLYIYQWQKTNPDDRFDAGLVNPDGSPRQAYSVLRKQRKLIR